MPTTSQTVVSKMDSLNPHTFSILVIKANTKQIISNNKGIICQLDQAAKQPSRLHPGHPSRQNPGGEAS